MEIGETQMTVQRSRSNNSIQNTSGGKQNTSENPTIILVDQNFNILNTKDINLNLNFDIIPPSLQ